MNLSETVRRPKPSTKSITIGTKASLKPFVPVWQRCPIPRLLPEPKPTAISLKVQPEVPRVVLRLCRKQTQSAEPLKAVSVLIQTAAIKGRNISLMARRARGTSGVS